MPQWPLVATDTWLSVSPAVFPQGELAVATDGRRECGWNVKQKKPTNKCINICIIHKTKKTTDKQKDKPLYVAFSTQKDGAGKTAMLMASYLHYVKGYDVAVIDFPQYSIHDMRKRDMDTIMKDDYYKVQAYDLLRQLGKKYYPVVCSRAEDAISSAESLCRGGKMPDVIFFDLPGTINNAEIVNTVSRMDYIFTPIIADRVVMESSIKFATVINEQMVVTGKSAIKGIYLIWNMVDGREKTELYEAYEKVCAEFALPILSTRLPDSKRFRKEMASERKAVFRSTIFPPDKVLVRGSSFDALTDEILSLIHS